MKCLFCGKTSPPHTLFRVNAKGQTGVWACRAHIRNTDATVDPMVKEITNVLEQRKREDK